VGDYKASKTAVDAFSVGFRNSDKQKSMSERITETVNQVNDCILSEKGYYKGMKSTFVACVLDKRNSKLYYISIGDSRLYAITNQEVRKITEDQVKAVIRRKQDGSPLTQDGAIVSAIGITNALGLEPLCFVVQQIEIDNTTSFILASDGFYTKLAEDYHILKELHSTLYFEGKFIALSKEIAQRQDDDATAVFFRVANIKAGDVLKEQQVVFELLTRAIKENNEDKAFEALDSIETKNYQQTFKYYDDCIKNMRLSNFNSSEVFQRTVMLLKNARK
jgi:serine/threonine protein phosphatase PrpC